MFLLRLNFIQPYLNIVKWPLSNIFSRRVLRQKIKIYFFLSTLFYLHSDIYAFVLEHKKISTKNLSNDKRWLALIHYRKNLFGHLESYADGQQFFFHPKGKEDSYLELEATIKAFLDQRPLVGSLKLSPACAFPARYKYISQKLQITFPPVKCPQYEVWKKNIRPKDLSFIFSSSYPNNPASLFGHTFLKIHLQDKNDLLDYGVNFSADLGTDEGTLFYPIWGLFGKYQGRFALAPFYTKVNEYNYSEARDLWEYKLNLNQDQLDFFLDHLWELYQNTYFDYYFIGENCSFHLLGLLDVVDDKYNFAKQFPVITAPSLAIKSIMPIVKEIKYRPGLKTQVKQYYLSLNHRQKDKLAEIMDKEDWNKIDQIEDPYLLKFIVKMAQYRQYSDNVATKTKFQNLLHKSLVKSAQTEMSVNPPEPSGKEVGGPHIGHGPSYIAPNLTHHKGRTGVGLTYRMGYHDWSDLRYGYDPFYQIELLKIRGSFLIKENRFELNQLNPISIISLFPSPFWDPHYSWAVQATYDQLHIGPNHKINQNVFQLKGSVGMTSPVLKEKMVLSMLLSGNIQVAKNWPNQSYRFGPSIDLYWLLPFEDKFNFIVSHSYFPLFFHKTDIGRKGYHLFQFIPAYHLNTNDQLKMTASFNFSSSTLIKRKGEILLEFIHHF